MNIINTGLDDPPHFTYNPTACGYHQGTICYSMELQDVMLVTDHPIDNNTYSTSLQLLQAAYRANIYSLLPRPFLGARLTY